MLKFGEALENGLKKGKKIARTGWNGKGMWIALFSSLNIGIEKSDTSIDFDFDDEENGERVFNHWKHYDGDISYKLKDCICMFTANSEIQMGWNASTPDLLSEDWVIL